MNFFHQDIPWPSPESLAALVVREPHRLWLDSALAGHSQSRFSLVVASPLAVLQVDASGRGRLIYEEGEEAVEEPLAYLQEWLNTFRAWTAGLPDFCGGAAGFLSYEFYASRCKMVPSHCPADFPLAYFLLVDSALLLDHHHHRAIVFSWGIEADFKSFNPRLAEQRCRSFIEELALFSSCSRHSVEISAIQPMVTKKDYLLKIDKIKEAICAGECYQVNLSQKFLVRGRWEPEDLYLRLRAHSPAPQMALLNLGEIKIFSSSPEVLMEGENDIVRSYPIKGTRPRGESEEADRKFQRELWESAKDNAELLMIVDLVRNDLGKICKYGTVRVSSLKRLEVLPHINHLVACVEGELKAGESPLQALLALFPGGSISGAPKLKAIEWINRLEESPRGIYTGNIGFLSFQGKCGFNIAIRTAVQRKGVLEYFVGGGIVADSDPESEYRETLHKAEGLFRALGVKAGDFPEILG